ncbi:MAG: triose-phosphate isomerase [Pseudomonadota bacterium]
MPRTLIAGNWKMNGLKDSLTELDHIVEGLSGAHTEADIALCGPATLVALMAERALGSRLLIGGQTCHHAPSGAHTGDISAPMLKDAGASHVIVGHSERREAHAERSTYVQEQAYAALEAALIPIICIGENYNERQRGETDRVNERVLRKSMPYPGAQGDKVDFVVAYEPKWAIGTGQTPTMEQIESAHAHIRSILIEHQGEAGVDVQILYGGSMKPGNAAEILNIANVNGGLIGGASLKAEDFLAIYEAAASEPD